MRVQKNDSNNKSLRSKPQIIIASEKKLTVRKWERVNVCVPFGFFILFSSKFHILCHFSVVCAQAAAYLSQIA